MRDRVRIRQHIAAHAQHRAGDDVDKTESDHCCKGASGPFLCPGASDGCRKQDMQVIDDTPANLRHCGAESIHCGDISSHNDDQITDTDHQSGRRHYGDDRHKYFTQFLQEIKVDRKLFLFFRCFSRILFLCLLFHIGIFLYGRFNGCR